jgi:hypothetical protein
MQRAEHVFGTSLGRMKLKRGSAMLFAKTVYADEETRFRDGDTLVCVEGKLSRQHGSSSSLSALSRLGSSAPSRSGLGERIASSIQIQISPAPDVHRTGYSDTGVFSPSSLQIGGYTGSASSQARPIGHGIQRPLSPQTEKGMSLSKSPKTSLLGSLISRGFSDQLPNTFG